MRGWVALSWLLVTPLLAAQPLEGQDGLITRIRQRMQYRLARMPDYVCLQTVERYSRPSPDAESKKLDTLRLQVGFAGGKEIFAWQGADRFEEKSLAEMVGAGTVGTGSFAVHASNVFLSDAPNYTFRGEEKLGDRRTLRFDYSVPQELSRYKLRVSPFQAYVAFHGSFWVDSESLDLIRLSVQADDIPEELQLARAAEVMEYSPAVIGNSEFLLPKSSELVLLGSHGHEDRNRRQLSACRQYVGEASFAFNEAAPVVDRPPRGQEATQRLPAGIPLDLLLDSELDPETAAVGDPVRALLQKPVIDGGQVLAPEGAVVYGRLVRLEKNSMPVDHYVIGLEFDMVEAGGSRIAFSATLEDAGPHSGLIRESKRFMPTFDRHRAPRLEILVRERQEGQGVLHWKAGKRRLPRGFKMRWRTTGG